MHTKCTHSHNICFTNLKSINNMESNFEISCPCCGEKINVNNVLKEQLLNDLQINLKNEKDTFFKNHVSKIEDENKRKLTAIKVQAEKNLEELSLELEKKSQKIKELSGAQVEIIKLKKRFKEKEDLASLEMEKRIQEALEKESERLVDLAAQKSEFEIKSLQKQLKDQVDLTNEMKRKQDQGSVQLQGEAGELIVESWLKDRFKLDEVIEIKKGENGADCLQKINTREKFNCGTIYYESKRTKTFQNSWIEKFKDDIREKGADVGVLVTKTMPPGADKICKMNGVLVCGFNEFKIIAPVLRDSLIQLNSAQSAGENKTDKMSMLYSFLTSNEFKLQVEGIVEGITQMQEDIIREKNAHKKLWKQREKQLDKVVNNTISMYGSIKGIAGKNVPEVQILSLQSNPEKEIKAQ